MNEGLLVTGTRLCALALIFRRSLQLPDGSVIGEGRRGDLAATVVAKMLDEEALAAPGTSSESGKLREPVLRFTYWARALNVA